MLTRIAHQLTVQTGLRIAQCDPWRAWAVLLIPTTVVVTVYMLWSASLLMRPFAARPDSYTVYLRTEYAAMRQKLRDNELALLAVQVRQRKLELDLLQAQYSREGKPPALPAVTRPHWKAALK